MHGVEIRIGHVLDELGKLGDGSVQCVATSPPYWGLRDYGLEPVVWGGEPGCWHEWGEPIEVNATNHTDKRRWQHTRNGRDEEQPIEKRVAWLRTKVAQGSVCSNCGAWAGSLGLEPTPELFVEHLVSVFREVRRVLRGDGTCWLNLGDSYSNDGKWGGSTGGKHVNGLHGEPIGRGKRYTGLKPKDLCLIPAMVAKALQRPYYTGTIRDIADRVWLAAIIDGEGSVFIHRQPAGTQTGRGRKYQRTQDNFCVGLSVSNTNEALVRRSADLLGARNLQFYEADEEKRRRSHWQARITGNKAKNLLREIYPYLVAKQREARIAISCPPSGDLAAASWIALKEIHKGIATEFDATDVHIDDLWEPGWYLRSEIVWAKPNPMPESVRDRPTKAHEMVYLLSKSERYYYDWKAVAEPSQMRDDVAWRVKYGGYDAKPTSKVRSKKHGDGKPDFITDGPRYWPETRNLRSVWTIATAPYPEAHFATFPPALVEPCIKAGTAPGDTVLDPFAGSGTVGEVARKWGRKAILIEAQPQYRKLIEKRLRQGVLIA